VSLSYPFEEYGLSLELPSMAKKSKDARSYIKLVSSESDHCYFVQKNRNNTKQRLELRKYDPTVRKHVNYKEGK
jgi:large subunit ribosomal protein L33